MYIFLKRVIDLFLGLFLLVLLLVPMLVISFLVKFSSPKDPIIYKAVRAAKKKKKFFLYKFRTMVVNAEELGGPSTAIDDPRFTTFGRTLRKYKLDELPQLFNVLKGDISFVGPRPQVFYYVDKYSKNNMKILSVKPGITDFASLFFYDMDETLGSHEVDLKYENEIEPIKNKLRLYYVENISFKNDLIILFATFFSLFPFFRKRFKHLLNFHFKRALQ